jgi:hypothetical protein
MLRARVWLHFFALLSVGTAAQKGLHLLFQHCVSRLLFHFRFFLRPCFTCPTRAGRKGDTRLPVSISSRSFFTFILTRSYVRDVWVCSFPQPFFAGSLSETRCSVNTATNGQKGVNKHCERREHRVRAFLRLCVPGRGRLSVWAPQASLQYFTNVSLRRRLMRWKERCILDGSYL